MSALSKPISPSSRYMSALSRPISPSSSKSPRRAQSEILRMHNYFGY
jgi:hypothetical protein